MSDLEPLPPSQVPEGVEDLLMWYANPKKAHHKNNVDQMKDIVEEQQKTHGVVFWHPNKNAAPWHIQCIVKTQYINLWPCALKAQIDGENAIHGANNIRMLFNEAHDYDPKEWDLIDKGDENE